MSIYNRERVTDSIEYEVKASEFEATAYSYLAAVIKLFNGGIKKVTFDNVSFFKKKIKLTRS